MNKLIIILSLLIAPVFVQASDNLVIIQSISNSKKTFVIRKGRDFGISKGQISLFSTTDISFTARATEVTRFYSLWTLLDKEATVPFNPEEVVTYTSSLERIWSEVALTKLREVEQKQEESYLRNIVGNYISLRASWGVSLSQSTSEVAAESLDSRTTLHFEATYSKRMNRHLEIGGGVRFDSDTAKGTNPDRSIPSTRNFLIADITYHFNQLRDSRSHIYAGLGAGIGKSSTEVADSTKTGSATLLPYFRLGYETSPEKSSYSFIAELQIENIVAKETFTTGDEQSTGIVNSKFAIGVRF
ncbi:putative exported protein [Halobacteriovorax marinus SJ]|uniref:Exported protein n=1 Tax=Halobacteriovorax marinus (strain ATCC BAA-682 / DSM 15412 / SJ) TaxID=862908 RepID=E1X0S0_HALMS|nr:hypothetical protein [Halobacteriovorax marinus]CBW26408.1 putative exported protein [Halobacteriovorax marinus SJ]